MMRWIFATLVLANLGLLMWASWYRDEPGAIVSPRPVYHPELMVPLTTPGVALKSRRGEHKAAPLVATKPRQRCITIGPFPASLAEKAHASLTAERQPAERRGETLQVESSYWVHLGPFADRKQAEQRKRELEKQGIRDLLVMQTTEGTVAISLGLFSQAGNARQRMEELAKQGIEARQDIRHQSETRYWLDLRVPEPADAVVKRLRERDWAAAGIEVRDSSCPNDTAPPAASSSANREPGKSD